MDYLSAHTVESFWDELEKMAYAYNDDQEDDRRAAKSRREAGALVGAGALGVAGAGGYAYNKQQKAMAREVAEEMAARSIKGRAGVAAAGLGAFAMGAFGKGIADAAGGSVERAGRNTWAAPGKALARRRADALAAARARGRKKAKIRKAQVTNATAKSRVRAYTAYMKDLQARKDTARVLKRHKSPEARRNRQEFDAKRIRESRNNPPAGHTPRWRAPKRGK